MSLRRLLWAVLVAALLVPSAAVAQESSPEPADENECAAGELCGSGEREDGPEVGTQVDALDPPGNYTRSLATLGLIAAVVGAYLFIALTGRSVFRRKPKKA